MEQPRDFTIVCDATMPSNDHGGVYTCTVNGNGDSTIDAGFSCNRSGSLNECVMVGKCSTETMIEYSYYEAEIVRNVLVFKNGVPIKLYVIDKEGGEVQEKSFVIQEGKLIYRTHNETLLLGCGLGWWQTKNNFANMTMYDFEVWNYAMTAEEAKSKLEEL